jgi:hypothetical protein
LQRSAWVNGLTGGPSRSNLQGETEKTQERRADEITDETIFTLGVLAEGNGEGGVEVIPQLVVVP